MYADDETLIYEYKIGDKVVFADPLRIERHLAHELGGDINAILKSCHDENDAISFPAIEKLLQAVRNVFVLPCVDMTTGKGVPDAKVLTEINRFLDWKDAQKKSTETSPTSARSSDANTLPIDSSAA